LFALALGTAAASGQAFADDHVVNGGGSPDYLVYLRVKGEWNQSVPGIPQWEKSASWYLYNWRESRPLPSDQAHLFTCLYRIEKRSGTYVSYEDSGWSSENCRRWLFLNSEDEKITVWAYRWENNYWHYEHRFSAELPEPNIGVCVPPDPPRC